jgi:phospholipid-binding lipoprotein MlaA
MHRVVSPLRNNCSQYILSLAIVIVGFACTGCATPGRTTGDDPWVNMNRGIYKFNDGVDRAVVKPVAKGYKAITPSWFRGAIGRFFANLDEPLTIVNQLLQGKPKLFFQDTGRFVTNSTLGIGGLFDVADKMHMPAHDEDFGQTLAVWGVPAGPYFTLPFFGPSTVRDAPMRIPEFFFGDLGYFGVSDAVEYGLLGLNVIDTRASLLAADSTLDNAYDKYGVMRDAWIQRRVYLIYDGNPPEEMLELPPDDADAERETTATESKPPEDKPEQEQPVESPVVPKN